MTVRTVQGVAWTSINKYRTYRYRAGVCTVRYLALVPRYLDYISDYDAMCIEN